MATEKPILDIPGLEYVGPVRRAPKETRPSILDQLEYVSDVRTTKGYARETAKEVAGGAVRAGVASPLKGLGALQYSNELQSNKTLLYPMMRGVADKLRDPKTRAEGISELEGYRDSWIYGLEKEQKAALDDAIKRAKSGESDPDKLMGAFESVKPTPIDERAAFKAGQYVEKKVDENLARSPGYKDSFGLDIAGAVGSTVGSVGQAIAIGGPTGLMAASALQGIDEQLGRAREAGLKDEEAAAFAAKGAGPGAVGMLSVEFILRKIPPVARKQMLRIAGDVAKSGTAEAVTEAVQQMMQNRIEQQYHPDRDLMAGTIYEGVLGGAAGMGVRAGVLLAMKVKGGRSVGASGDVPEAETQAELAETQKELATKEIYQREQEKAKSATGAQTTPPPKTPAEAAKSGASVAGEPVTITPAFGEPYHATITERTAGGGFRLLDKDGGISEIDPSDLLPDPKTGKTLITKEDGWKRILTDEDIEANLSEYLALEGQWRKVTVETDNGIFKGIEGPRDPEGGRIFRDGEGQLQGFMPDAIRNVDEDWEPGAPATLQQVIGERAKEKSKAAGVTKAEEDSPIQTELLREGKEIIADTVGTGKANTMLENAGLPKVKSFISYKDDDGNPVTGTIEDATEGHVQILTTDGELISQPFNAASNRITPLPEFMRSLEPVKTKVRTEQPVGESVPGGRVTASPESRVEAPKGETVPEDRISTLSEARTVTLDGKEVPEGKITPSSESRISDADITKFLEGAKKEGNPVTAEQVQSVLSVPLDRAQQVAAATNELIVEPSKGKQKLDDTRERIKSAVSVKDREGAGNQAEYRQRETGPAQTRERDTEIETTPERKVDERQDKGQPKQEVQEQPQDGQVGRNVDAGQDGGPYEGKNVEEQEQQKDVGGWWDTVPHETRRKEIIKAGFTTEKQRVAYVGQKWEALPKNVRDLVIKQQPQTEPADESKEKTTEQPTLIAKPTQSEVKAETGTYAAPSTEARSATVEKPVAQEGLEYKKNGNPWDTEASAMMAVREETHEAVKVDGGWARRLKGVVAPKVDAKPEPKIEKNVEAKETEPEKVSYPEGVIVKKSGLPFDKANSAMLVARTQAKKDGGAYEAVEVEGGWGYRKMGKPRQQVKTVREPEVKKEISTKKASPQAKPEPIKVPPYFKTGEFWTGTGGLGFRTQAVAQTVVTELGSRTHTVVPSVGMKKGYIVTTKEHAKTLDWKSEPVTGNEQVPKAEDEKARKGEKNTDSQTNEIVWTPKLREKQKVLTKELRDYLDRLGLSDVSSKVDIEVLFGAERTPVSGMYAAQRDPSGGIKTLIQVSLTRGSPASTIRHESIHALKHLGVFTDKEWVVLERAAKSNKSFMEKIENDYGDLDQERMMEEAVAELFAQHKPKDVGIVARIFQRIKNFIEALGNALRKNGFNSSADVFSDIESGVIGKRPRETKSELERSERHASQALQALRDPTGGMMTVKEFARIPRHDEFFVEDMGAGKVWGVSPRTIAAFSRSFASVFRVGKEQTSTSHSVTADLGRRMQAYRDLKRDSKTNVNKLLELGRLEQKVYRPSANGTITVTATKETGLMKAGESVTLDADQVAAYKSVRNMLDAALDRFRDQTISDFGNDPTVIQTPQDVLALIIPNMGKGEAGKLRALSKLIHDIDQSKRTGYVPFSRFGNVVVLAEQVDPATGKATTLHSEMVDVAGLRGFRGNWRAGQKMEEHKDVARIKGDLVRRYPGARIRHFQVAGNKDNRLTQGVDVVASLTGLQGSDLEDAVARLHKNILSKGFRKHFLGSKNIPGYSIDIERNVADYLLTFSGFIARKQHAKDFEAAIRAIPENKPIEIKYAEEYRSYMNSPVEEYARTRQLGFAMLLAGNVSNAVANLTQVPLISAPYLSTFSNPARVSFELTRAYKDATKMLGGSWREVFNPDKAPQDVRMALKQAWDEGEFTPLAMHDIMGVAYNTKASSRRISAAAKTTMDFIALMQTSSERANRLVTFIAAYRLANRDPNFKQKAETVLAEQELAQEILLPNFSPLEFAKFIVDETQYDVGKMNRAKMFRGPGAAILQFKPFIANTLELQVKTALLHKGGHKSFAMMMAALLMSSGLYGLPGSDDGTFLYELAYKWWTKVDKDVKTETREILTELTGSPFAAEMIMYGPFRMLGVDVTNRIGIGKIIPRDLEELAGVPFNLYGARAINAVGHAKEGRWLEASMEFMPLWARNPVTAQQWRENGVRTQKGDPVMKPEEISAIDVAVKSVGFNPRTVAERREMEWAQQRSGKAIQEKKAKYYRTLARSFVEAGEAANTGDQEEFQKQVDKYKDTMMEIQEWNDKVIEKKEYNLVIVINEAALDRKKQEEVLGRGPVRAARAPLATRPRQQEIRELYGEN